MVTDLWYENGDASGIVLLNLKNRPWLAKDKKKKKLNKTKNPTIMKGYEQHREPKEKLKIHGDPKI